MVACINRQARFVPAKRGVIATYKALYRTWRPATFDDVVGQQNITVTLKNEVKLSRVAHSYLFTGSRGTGKTTCAKILAKAVNCLDPQDGNPCGKCELCLGIEAGAVTDVMEIDAASNNGVDDVRALREEAVFTPVSAKYRVYIIDEAHMLSTAAFNALLKIMEEPPAHVLFILATTEVHKVPATIISRCQRFDFGRIDTGEIKKRLLYIAQQENIPLGEDAAQLIARISEGGMRDAISLLDQCATLGQDIDVAAVSRAAGLADNERLYELCDAAAQGDSARALEIIDRLSASSVDYTRLMQELMGLWRNFMVAKVSPAPETLMVCTPEDLARIRDAAARYPMELIVHALSVLGETLDGMARAQSKRLAAELCMVRLSTPSLDSSPDALLRRISQLEARALSPAAIPAAFAPQTPPHAEKFDDPPPAPPEVLEVEQRFAQWDNVLERLSKTNPALHGTLVGSSAYVTGDLVLIDANDSMFAEMMRKNEYTKMSLREALRLETGKVYRLGPVKKNVQIKETGGLLAELEQKAREAGIDVN